MPMVLRPRKSMHRNDGEDDDDDEEGEQEESEAAEMTATVKRKSPRLPERPTSTESEGSDSDTVHSREMERLHSDEETVGETDDTEVKHCSVVLDRLGDKAPRREPEERDDMSRKSAKPASRIPTFHKRPALMSVELPVSKKDPPVTGFQPADKPASVDASKSKFPDARDKAHSQPSVRSPRVGLEALIILSTTDQAAAGAAPKGYVLSEGVQPSLVVSPRPSLRAEESLSPEENKIQHTDIDVATAHLLCMDSLCHNLPQEETPQKPYIATKRNIPLTISKELTCMPDVSQTMAIVDEKPPWESEDANVVESKDLRSSSDIDSEDDLAMDDSRDAKDRNEPQTSEMDSEDVVKEEAEIDDEAACPAVAEKPATAPSTKPTKRSGCSCFALRFLLPATLLLLGMHIWRFGLPMSVGQLTAHLELHWLEGMGHITEQCSRDCRVSMFRVHLVESFPAGLYPSSPSPQQSTAASWLRLLDEANSSVSIAALYMLLRSSESDFPNTIKTQGRKVFERLKQLPSKHVKLNIAVNGPQTMTQDTTELAAAGANIREVDLKSLSGGIVHTKLLVIDQKHFYLGSANMDWRSLSQVKEVGVAVEDCSCLAQDAARIFEMYWSLSGSLPPYWPARFTALSSSQHPLQVNFNGVAAKVYLSSAPPQISARGRSDDLTTILSVISDAREFVFISVMDYLPLSEFTKPLRFWPAIDSALRAAACTRGVKIRLLVSCWEHSPAAMFTFLQSLLVLNRPPMKCHIEVKVFTVPSTAEQMKIPFARVNHAKYMVTDRVLYIGTSNWSENYFTETAGVGLVVNQTDSEVKQGQWTLQSQAEELFLRDWRSHYASSLSAGDVRVCPRIPH
ncbi:5'-3' exonuclease PLD3 isoform X1 [Phyllopteryx taeniolatus]|uniref:5'-3' exonuclease PLD3 isoform X1 n=1 Tax=Phyllopteryx taeniolatus TaxID=161469 RepID=UPI002AD3D638|nr:5'-3' exonuclease PLD3 isoform X1 [Phyllopteryx taeniolatus]